MSFARSMPCFCLQQTSAQPGQTLFVYSSMSGESQVRSSLSCRAMVSFVSGMECGPSGDKRVQGQGRHDEEQKYVDAAERGEIGARKYFPSEQDRAGPGKPERRRDEHEIRGRRLCYAVERKGEGCRRRCGDPDEGEAFKLFF